MSGRLGADDRRVAIVAAAAVLLVVMLLALSRELFSLRLTYTVRVVTIGGAVLGAISGVLGSFAVLRHQSLLGDALSHAALPGVAVAFLLAGRRIDALLVGAALAGLLGVAFIRLITRMTRIKEDTAHGIVLAGWFAAGIAVLTFIQGLPTASQAGLDSFIFGQAAAIVRSDILTIAVIGGVAILVALVFWKELKLAIFDPDFARAVGVRVGFFNALQSSLFVIAVVIGLQIAGVVLMVGLLVAPGVAARQWSDRLRHMIALAAVFGALAGAVGALSSAFDADIPTGPMIIVAAFIIVLVSILFAPARGVVWRTVRRRRNRTRYARLNVLRDLYHYIFDHPESGRRVPERFLTGVRPRSARRGLTRLQSEGAAERVEQEESIYWTLTDRGMDAARADARNAALWDRYRLHRDELGLPAVGEERGRRIEDLLEPRAVDALVESEPGDLEEPRVRD